MVELLQFAFRPDVTSAVRPGRTDVREEFPGWNLLMSEGKKKCLQSDAVVALDSAEKALLDKRVHVFAKGFPTTYTLVNKNPRKFDGENVKYVCMF